MPLEEIFVIFDSWPTFALSCAVLFLAQVVYVVFGFGAGLIAVGLLAIILPELQDVVVMVLMIGIPSELFVIAKDWRAIRWRSVLPLGAGVVAGTPVGVWLLRGQDASFLLGVLGGVLVLVGLAMLAASNYRRVQWPNWVAPPVGVVSGVLAGLFGTGGPPVILYFQLEGVSKKVFRSSLMSLFLLVTLIRIPTYAAVGLLTMPRLLAGISLLPAALLGMAFGHMIQVQLPDATFRRLVSGAIAILGLVLLFRTL